MRILLIGQAAFAARVLERLLADGDEVAAVVCPPDRTAVDPVKAAAEERGITVHQFPSLKRPEARAAFERADADLAVLAFVTQIVPEPLLAIPRRTAICFHPSLLPRYRGGSAIPWQLIRGETTTGVTVFWPDAGIDTGPILLQRQAPVDPDDTAGALYYRTIFPLGVDAVVEACALVRAGNAPRLPQDESQATYDPLLTDEHAGIDWSQATASVRDLIRGCDPQPGAWTIWRGERVRLYGPARVVGHDGTEPGTVLAIAGDGISVATRNGAVRCARVRDGGEKIAAADGAHRLGITPGARLGE